MIGYRKPPRGADQSPFSYWLTHNLVGSILVLALAGASIAAICCHL